MAATPTNTIKTWFETADKPTQQQFWDWLDSMRNKLDPIPAGDISGLVAVIDDRITQVGGGVGEPGTSIYMPVTLSVSSSETYSVAAEKLAKDFIIIPTSPGLVKIGLTAGGSEVFETTAGDTAPLFADVFNFSLAARTLHFTGAFQVRFILADYAS